MRWRSWSFPGLGGLVLLLLLTVLPQGLGWLAPLDRLFYDAALRAHPPRLTPDIVLVEIDQKSLERLGRWPWRRALHAHLLERLAQDGAAAVGMDINFAEPDRERPEDDRRLVEAVTANGRVVLPVVLEPVSATEGLRETLPFPALAQGAAALGHVDVELDDDGIARSAYLRAGLYRARWPALPLAMLQLAHRWPPERPLPGERAPAAAEEGERWRRDYRIGVPFPPADGGFRRHSYVDVLEARLPPGLFTDKLVLVGATAAGLGDTIPTPASARGRPASGVEYLAALLNALATRQWIETASPAVRWSVILLVVFLAWLPTRLLPGRGGLLILALLPPLLALGSDLLLTRLHYWLPPAAALLAPLVMLGVAGWQRAHELWRRLQRERERSLAALSSVADAVIELDDALRIRRLNSGAERLLAVKGDQVLGKRIGDLVWLERRGEGRAPFGLQEFLGAGKSLQDEVLLLKNGRGEHRPVQLAVTRIPGEPGGSILVLSDLSREEQLAARLVFHETHDLLSGLPNRESMLQRLEEMVGRAQQMGHQVAVVAVGIDQFPNVSQVMGMEAGDRLLRQMGRRLRSLCSRGMEAGHLGRDRFLVLLCGRDLPSRIAILREELGRPMEVDGQRGRLSVSLGVSLYPDNLADAETLLCRAEIALQRCWQKRPGEIVYFQENMQRQAERVLQLTQLLQRALEEELLETLFQPIFTARDGRLVAVECFMRLGDGRGGQVPPEEFVPVAESSGIIGDLAFHQLEEACRHLERWHGEGLVMPQLACNFTARQLRAGGLLTRLTGVLQETNFDPAQLRFEIPEALLVEEDPEVVEVLEGLRRLGVTLVLDDFGWGQGRLDYLERFGFERIKIDKAYVRDLDSSPGSRPLVAAILGMAHRLDLRVTAAGVENGRQAETLRTLGCDELQGCHLARPMSAEAFHDYLVSLQARARTGLYRYLA